MNNIMENIKSLRELTGSGFLDCKKALEENENDIDKSVDFLRKKGLAKANKKSSREAKEGAIGIYTNKYLTSIIQINTETDFAAKNEVFLNFVDEIGNYVLKQENPNLKLNDFNKVLTNNNISISDYFKEIIVKIGENIVLSKLVIIENNDQTIISNYIHNSYRKNIGKIAVILKSKVSENNEESKILGKNLCMHIAASKPLAMNINELDDELIEKEKKVQIETIRASGKSENIIDKILKGKMNKFYSESILMNQPYILDPDKTITDIINEFSIINKFEIIDYKLVVLGS